MKPLKTMLGWRCWTGLGNTYNPDRVISMTDEHLVLLLMALVVGVPSVGSLVVVLGVLLQRRGEGDHGRQ